MTWKPDSFLTAVGFNHTSGANGYSYRGLGLHQVVRASPKGRRPPTWSLTHLETGHRIMLIEGFVADAFPIASEVAECSEWDFTGLEGWKNRDPELIDKLRAIKDRYGKRVRFRGGSQSDEAAKAIALARA